MGIPRCPWGIPKDAAGSQVLVLDFHGVPNKTQPLESSAGLNTCMQTFQASVRVRVDGRSQIVQTQVRAPNSSDARWLLWAQFGFHSITSGPSLVKN